MRLESLCLLLSLAALMLAQGADARTSSVPHPDPCCKTGYFCCGGECQPSWKAALLPCPEGPGCCKPRNPCEDKPFVVGNCRGAFPRYSYNPKTKQCKLFLYGGCGGTHNNFEKEADCIETCGAKPLADCCEPGKKCCGDACIPDDAHTKKDCGDPTCCEAEPCECPEQGEPVCYLPENKTLSNKCFSACKGFTGDNLIEGPCPPKPKNCCPKDKPVCCGDGCITKKQAPITHCPVDRLCGCYSLEP